MRSRSTRLFIVLLHLVGVSTNLPRRHGSHVGIVGVHPMAIMLERLELEAFKDGLDGLLKQAAEWGGDEEILGDPYWLQDDVDGKCYGPGGFSECGDATLWQLQRRSSEKARTGLWSRLMQKQRDGGYALLSVDAEMVMASKQTDSTKNQKRRKSQGECLVADPLLRRRRGNAAAAGSSSLLGLGDCASMEKAWSWQINGKGVLFQEYQQNTARGSSMHMSIPPSKQTTQTHCLWRSNATAAVLSPCNVEPVSDQEVLEESRRLVSFSLVRYQASASPSVDESHPSVTTTRAADPLTTTSNAVEAEEEEEQSKGEHVKVTKDKAHSQASGQAMHPDLKPANELLFPCLGDSQRCGPSPLKRKSGSPPFSILRDSHPMLFDMERRDGPSSTEKDNAARPKSVITSQQKLSSSSGGLPSNAAVAGTIPKDTMALVPMIGRPRRIPVHPYIATCKSFVWTDPQTGLEYPTDLSGYLGQDRKATGRHTLTGVGQYTRTVFNIKVYGVAFYVSKRDVLADPVFERYATMSAEELRGSESFYSHLRHMPSPTDPNAGLFDRTLLLKLNMQISTDTMRSSLEADWKMLTDEHKNLLINTSLNPRPAREPMLKKIQSDDNPSNCSCGQVAPEEYGADPSCCARGTELGFTWRKSGDLEIRIDGRIMDVFPMPDLAEGIFYEYLRVDDPISRDTVERIPDGFPFLLAPLAQVKGVSSPVMSASIPDSGSSGNGVNGIVRVVGHFADMVSTQTVGFTGWVQSGATGIASNVVNAARMAGDSARNLGDEMDRRRGQLWNHMVSMPEQSVQFLSARVQGVADNVRTRRDRRKGLVLVSTTEASSPRTKSAPRGRVFRSPMAKWLGDAPEAPLPDEIGPIIHPTMNTTRTLFLYMVHLYLLLLLIVSMPGSYNTRTKLVVRKACASKTCSDVESDETSGSEEDCGPEGSLQPRRRKMVLTRARKRLSNSMKRRSRTKLNDEEESHSSPSPQETKKTLSYYM